MVTMVKRTMIFLLIFSLPLVCLGNATSSTAQEPSSYRFINFDWPDHPQQFVDMAKPVNYEIQIATDKSFKQVIDTDTIGLSRYVHDRPFDAGTYYWRVRTILFDGKVEQWRRITSFNISAPQVVVQVARPIGQSNCIGAVNKAIKEAKASAASGKTVKVVFPAGDYYFNDHLTRPLIQLKDVSNIEIEGTGATLHFTNRKQGLIAALRCENISISGFNVTYAPGVFRVQGRVKQVDEKKRIVTVAIESGSPDFSASDSIAQDVFILIDDTIDGRLKDNSSTFYRMDSYEKKEDGTFTVQLNKGGDISDWQVGGRYVYHFRSGSTMYVDFPECKNVTAYQLTTDGWGGMGFVSKKGSNYNILHCDTIMQKGKWMMGNADGVHIREHVVGPWIEGTHIQGLGDDGLALYARPVVIAKSKPDNNPKAAVCDAVFFNFEAGDAVSFFEPTQGKILLETKVVKVTKRADGKYLVLFEDVLPDGMITADELANVKANQPKVNGGWDSKANSGKLQDRTQIWNRSKSCGEFVIRHSKFTNIRRYASVFRAKRGVIENNVYKSASSRAINFRNETAWPNGLYASEMIISNNVIDDCGFDGAGTQAVVSFNFQRRGGGIVQSIGARNLLIEGNTFIECPSPVIQLAGTDNVVIRKNKRADGAGGFKPVQYKAARSKRVAYSE